VHQSRPRSIIPSADIGAAFKQRGDHFEFFVLGAPRKSRFAVLALTD
jgi:hypothetical protein